MTETVHIPQHIDMTRRIAAQETASVTALTVQEAQLKAEYDRHQAEYEAEQKRIEAELRERAERAKEHLDRLADAGRKLSAAIADVGQRRHHHATEAEQAQQSVADWCTRQGIEPAALPPLPDTGPLPAIAAPAPEPRRALLSELTQEAVDAGTYGEPAPGMEPKLPDLEVSDAVLEAGRRAADPQSTRTDLPTGGDQPESTGGFQGGSDA